MFRHTIGPANTGKAAKPKPKLQLFGSPKAKITAYIRSILPQYYLNVNRLGGFIIKILRLQPYSYACISITCNYVKEIINFLNPLS